MKTKFKQDKGVAGLTILLSLVVMLFIIGLLVMIFTIMSSKMQESTYTSTTGSVVNESLTSVNELGENLAYYNLRNVVCSVQWILNQSNLVQIPTSNRTISNCNIKYTSASADTFGYNNSNWKVTYTYTYDADNTATTTINDTSSAISSVTDWFAIFIVIGAMVVLILLTVIIITAIRSSGMIAEGQQQGANQVGTA